MTRLIAFNNHWLSDRLLNIIAELAGRSWLDSANSAHWISQHVTYIFKMFSNCTPSWPFNDRHFLAKQEDVVISSFEGQPSLQLVAGTRGVVCHSCYSLSVAMFATQICSWSYHWMGEWMKVYNLRQLFYKMVAHAQQNIWSLVKVLEKITKHLDTLPKTIIAPDFVFLGYVRFRECNLSNRQLDLQEPRSLASA